jgi:hypothetical protein
MLTEVVRSGIPHLVVQDDIYKQMSIPKGSVIIANALYASSPTEFLKTLTLVAYIGAWHGMTMFTPIRLNSIPNGSYLRLLAATRSRIRLLRSGSDDGE